MANDREVLRLVWDGKIPICFVTDPKEVVGLQYGPTGFPQYPEPIFLMVSRLTYLPLVMDKVTKHFNRYISNEHQDEIWFECNGRPLKWNFPVGVLYDLFGKNGGDDGEELENPRHSALPWTITIHFGNTPSDKVMRCPNKEVVESQFMSALKEADFLKHRGQVTATMQKKDHSQLWLGLVNEKFDQFWAVNRRLMESVGDQEAFKSIPVRCYHPDGMYVQKLISPFGESNTKLTLKDLLQQFATNDRPYSSCLIHGIVLDLDTPIQWLSEHLSYPDNFLHICLLQEKDGSGEVNTKSEISHADLRQAETATEC